MVDVEFHYNMLKTNFIANEKETIKEVIVKANIKYITDDKNIVIIAHNKKIKNEDTIESIMNEEDKNEKKIKIIIIPLDNDNNNFKDIICPECLEPCRLAINNYRINLSHISGLHNKDNIKLSDFKKMQNDLLQKLECKVCNNKGSYKCSQCNFYFCEKCKDSHNKSHKIVNYEENKYVCNKHQHLFIKFCNQCDENICSLCETDNHSGHYISSYEELYPDINETYENLRKLKQNIDIFNKNLKEIILKLNKVIDNMEILYNINEKIINNYSNNYTNYGKVLNIVDINNFIHRELENIEQYEYGYNINKILYLYNEMESQNFEVELNYEFIPLPDKYEDILIPIFG